MTVGGHIQYCGLMTLCSPLWAGTALKLAGRMLVNPVRYFKKVDRSKQAFPDPIPDMKHMYVVNAGVRLHAATHGLGTGKPLMLLLHGFPETWASWRHQIREFAGRYEVVALDMRGYGGSDAPKGVKNYRLEKICSDIAAVVAAVGHTKCTLVGQDWGGAIAWLMACYYPELMERLVVLACPHPSAYRDPDLCDQEQMSRQTYVLKFQALGLGCSWLSHGDFQELEKWMTTAPHGALRPGAITSKDVERYKAAFSRPGSLAGAMSYYKASIAANTKWWDETAEKCQHTPITCPTLLMLADRDSIFLPKMFSRTGDLVEDLVTVQLDDCSHWANQDRPDLVNSAMNAFLQDKVPADTPHLAQAISKVFVSAGAADCEA